MDIIRKGDNDEPEHVSPAMFAPWFDTPSKRRSGKYTHGFPGCGRPPAVIYWGNELFLRLLTLPSSVPCATYSRKIFLDSLSRLIAFTEQIQPATSNQHRKSPSRTYAYRKTEVTASVRIPQAALSSRTCVHRRVGYLCSMIDLTRQWTGEDIKRLCEARGMRQIALAKMLGVREATISDWARGVVRIPRMACIALSFLELYLAGELEVNRKRGKSQSY